MEKIASVVPSSRVIEKSPVSVVAKDDGSVGNLTRWVETNRFPGVTNFSIYILIFQQKFVFLIKVIWNIIVVRYGIWEQQRFLILPMLARNGTLHDSIITKYVISCLFQTDLQLLQWYGNQVDKILTRMGELMTHAHLHVTMSWIFFVSLLFPKCKYFIFDAFAMLNFYCNTFLKIFCFILHYDFVVSNQAPWFATTHKLKNRKARNGWKLSKTVWKNMATNFTLAFWMASTSKMRLLAFKFLKYMIFTFSKYYECNCNMTNRYYDISSMVVFLYFVFKEELPRLLIVDEDMNGYWEDRDVLTPNVSGFWNKNI